MSIDLFACAVGVALSAGCSGVCSGATSDSPAFEMRGTSWRSVVEDLDLARRLRFNGERNLSQGTLGESRGAFDTQLKKCHTFYSLMSPDEFFSAHPEYFSEVKGRRLGVRTQLCLSNPDVLRICTERVLERIRQNPKAEFFGVSQMDWDNYCTCTNCRAIDHEEDSPAGSIIRFVNSIAAAVELSFPGKTIETLAYRYSRNPPKTRPRHNVMICLCADNLDRAEDLKTGRHPNNVAFRENLVRWGRLTDNIYIWDYTVNFRHYLNAFPNVYSLQTNLQFFAENGVRYVFEQGDSKGFGADFEDLKVHLLAKWMWNPYDPVEPLLDEFFSNYYGKGAEYVREYFRRIEALPHHERMGMYEGPDCDWRTVDFLVESDRLWQCAERATRDDPAALAHVRKGRMGNVYALLWRHRADFITVWCSRFPERFQAKTERWRDLVLFFESARRQFAPVRFSEGDQSNKTIEKRFDLMAESIVVPAKGATTARIEERLLHLTHEVWGGWGSSAFTRDPSVPNGEVLSVNASVGGDVAWLSLKEVAFDEGVDYALDVLMRKGEAVGGDDLALQIGIYNDCSGKWSVEAKKYYGRDLKSGYTPYRVLAWKPQLGDRIVLKNGHERTSNKSVRVYIDCLELHRGGLDGNESCKNFSR